MSQNLSVAIISPKTINALIKAATSELNELREFYALLPATRCERKTHCCSMLPEITFLEALAAFERLGQETAKRRRRTLKKIVEYFFINPARITACPFLEGKQCIIYEDRFFGCRAYGLWTLQHYESMTRQNRQAKATLSRQWQNLGIILPDKVIDFQLPYCLDVKTVNETVAVDNALVHISTEIEALSGRLSPWHQTFRRMNFADLSFLTTAMVYDISQVLKMKVDIVREYVSAGRSNILDKALENIPDFLGQL